MNTETLFLCRCLKAGLAESKHFPRLCLLKITSTTVQLRQRKGRNPSINVRRWDMNNKLTERNFRLGNKSIENMIDRAVKFAKEG